MPSDTLGAAIPAEDPDGTRRYLFGGTSQSGSQIIELKRGSEIVDLGIDHAYSSTSDDGDCGGVVVRSQVFTVLTRGPVAQKMR